MQVLCLLLSVRVAHSTAADVTIGAIFRARGDEHLSSAFSLAVEHAKKTLNVALRRKVEYVDERDFYDARKRLCAMVERGAAAMAGPTEPLLGRHLAALTDELGVPFLRASSGFDVAPVGASAVSLFPERQLLEAIRALVLHWNWTELIVVYKDDLRVARVVRLFEDVHLRSVRLRVVKVDGDEFVEAAQRLKTAEECGPVGEGANACPPDGYSRVLVDMSSADVHKFLLAGLQLGLIELKHWFVLTSLDIVEVDLDLFRHNHARIVGLDIIDRIGEVDKLALITEKVKLPWMATHPNSTYFPLTEAALMFDAVLAFANGYKSLSEVTSVPMGSAFCPDPQNDVRRHPQGDALFNHTNQQSIHSVTGNLMLARGERQNVSFNIFLLGYAGRLEKIGTWESAASTGVNLDEQTDSLQQLYVTRELKPHMMVTTIQERPYVMEKRNHYIYKGNEKFEGFCIDLLEKLAFDLGFTYSIHLVKDGKYGNENENGTWDGMIGEILRVEADMAVAPLTVNYKRAEHVDFTKPFLSLGISILFRIPTDQKPALFSFLNPLSMQIWYWIAIAAIIITFAMFLIARLTPYEWNLTFVCGPSGVPQPTSEENDRGPAIELTNNYSFMNTLWYVTSTLLKGGCDFGPRAASTRLLGGAWWVFTLVITSAYTANLAAVLTVDRLYIPIKSLEDLANQSEISYGAIEGGSTSQFFAESKLPTHMKIWSYMSAREESVFVASNGEGVDKVAQENYAYLMESTSLEYEVQQNCNLTQVGGVLGSKGYGIALHKHSPWTDRLSRQILDYSEKGVVQLMKTKWWRNKGASCTGAGSAALKEHRLSLNMQNVSGLFVILLAGLLLAIVSVVFEFCIRTRQNARTDKKSLLSEVGQELRFALHLHEPKQKRSLADAPRIPVSTYLHVPKNGRTKAAVARRLSSEL